MDTTTKFNDHLSTLREASQRLTQGAAAKPPRVHQSCEIAARLDAPPDTQDGRLVFQATAVFDGPHTRAGQTDTYMVRPEQVKACLENLNKGAGFMPGSVLVFGNAWRDQEQGLISTGWVTTAISAQKANAALNGHHARTLQQVYAQMPVLDFTPLHRAPGEPERIRWPLGLDRVEARVQSEGRWRTATFDRDWLKEKLEAAWEARAQNAVSINLRLPVLYPEHATPVRDRASAAHAVTALLTEHPYRSVLTRACDGETVATRWQPLMRGTEAAAWAEKLLMQTPGFDAEGQPVADPETGEQILVDQFSLIQGIDNRLLLDAAERGELRIEFLPRDSLLLATKNAPGLAQDVKAILQAESARELHGIAFAFGDDPEAVSRVALILQRQPDHKLFVIGHPIRLDVGPAYTVANLPSPHLPLPRPTAARTANTPASEPPEPALEPARVDDVPPFTEEDFALDAAALDAVLGPPSTPPTSASPSTGVESASSPAAPPSPRPTPRPAPTPVPPLSVQATTRARSAPRL